MNFFKIAAAFAFVATGALATNFINGDEGVTLMVGNSQIASGQHAVISDGKATVQTVGTGTGLVCQSFNFVWPSAYGDVVWFEGDLFESGGKPISSIPREVDNRT
ncbi:hypothetical protein GP486_008391 [Trichoglossum hirsutum]|uniref:Uncharacterized protein n=1 Tax=Trichoglossum hirsutum TaxID=265104 RepID=A0A9P8IA02_9PEZI|nr:hypothetical protein GP486_008391 [Trichoglossum hirsutum]